MKQYKPYNNKLVDTILRYNSQTPSIDWPFYPSSKEYIKYVSNISRNWQSHQFALSNINRFKLISTMEAWSWHNSLNLEHSCVQIRSVMMWLPLIFVFGRMHHILHKRKTASLIKTFSHWLGRCCGIFCFLLLRVGWQWISILVPISALFRLATESCISAWIWK